MDHHKKITFKNVSLKGDSRLMRIDVNLTLSEDPYVFACSADITPLHARDCIIWGQCLDTIKNHTSLKDDQTFAVIYDLWKKYHLNDLHAGTPKQEAAIRDAIADGTLPKYDYTQAVSYLKSIGLYRDESYQYNDYDKPYQSNGEAYAYGTGWLYEAIPDEDIAAIKKIIST
jgi:hypothetical protein